MTRDDIIHMEQEAKPNGPAFTLEERIAFLERFATLVTESEQERIAKMFDKTWLNGRTVGDMIRERVQP